MFYCNSLTLPNYEKVNIFKERTYRTIFKKPEFCDQFIKLWKLLYDVGIGNAPTFSGTVTSFPLPQKSSSRLVGVPYATDPLSGVRLYTFNNKDFNGPIVTNNLENNFNLETYNDEVSYKISWIIRTNPDNFIIGFYRSDGFVNDTTNTFSLICGDRGASIFNETCGSFISPGISNLFVAANQDVTIEMEVKVVIPNKIIYPLVNDCNSYEKFIKVTDRYNEKHSVLLYTISLINGFNIIKQPSKYFVKAAETIKQYLLATGLSVTLTSANNFPLLRTCSDCVTSICDPTIIGTREYNTGVGFEANVSMDTHNTCDPQYYLAGVYQGIKLNPPSGKVSNIKYKISTSVFGTGLRYRITICIQYKSGLLWFTHDNVNEDGTIGNPSELILIEEDGSRSFEGSFRISETAKAFGITVYYNSSAFNFIDSHYQLQQLTTNTKFDQISISYEDRVIQ